jgi:hypothetical protein
MEFGRKLSPGLQKCREDLKTPFIGEQDGIVNLLFFRDLSI